MISYALPWWQTWLSLITLVQFVTSTHLILDYPGDNDLASYVTQPHIRPPLLNVTVHHANQISPGYFFATSYEEPEIRRPSKMWAPYQVGPHIYDSQGELVWSGAHLFPHSVTHDFRVVTLEDHSPGLSFVLGRNTGDFDYARGARFVLDSSYRIKSIVNVTEEEETADMHEFYLTNDGRSAIYIIHTAVDVDVQNMERNFSYAGVLISSGFREIDLASGDVVFEWYASNHTDPWESSTRLPAIHGPQVWDNIHLNSVEKTRDGDYIVSARHTDTIYKVSHTDGSIIWRLGGIYSSFTLANFNFSKQHDARVLDENNGNTTVLSFLNNAADEFNRTSSVSSAMVVALDTSTMTATLLRSYDRPDGELSTLRGNVQSLPNGNILAAWSNNSYISEFTEDGQLVLEASFSSHRFVSYRGYKHAWVGHPIEAPSLNAYAYGTTTSTTTTVFHVSWNGATEVVSWRFWGACSNATNTEFTPLGSVSRTGFETMFQASGSPFYVYAEGLAEGGVSLGVSPVTTNTFQLNAAGAAATCTYPITSAPNSTQSSYTLWPFTSPSVQRVVPRQVVSQDGLQTLFNVVSAAAWVFALALFVRRRCSRTWRRTSLQLNGKAGVQLPV